MKTKLMCAAALGALVAGMSFTPGAAQAASSLAVQAPGGIELVQSQQRARPTNPRDRAYMDGGMIVEHPAGQPWRDHMRGQSMQGQAMPGQPMRDAAGHPMGGMSNSGEGPGSNNLRPTPGGSTIGGGTAMRTAPRDAQGNPLSAQSPSGAEGAGSNNERAGGGTAIQGTGMGARPNPSSGAVGGPMSNNPMNDPVGGDSGATRPGFNQNR